MKKIEAVIRPEKLEKVVSALEAAECPGMMITEIKGHGRQKGIELEWRAGTYKINRLPKIKIEIVVRTDQVQTMIDTIAEHAFTGEVGDGKIFVLPVEEVSRIRTKENGEVAV